MSTMTATPKQAARIDQERRRFRKSLDLALVEMEKAEQSGDVGDDLIAAMLVGLTCNPGPYLDAVKAVTVAHKKEN